MARPRSDKTTRTTKYVPGHPLANADGRVRTARLVLYEKVGSGPQECHWCGKRVLWLPGNQPGAICADHLDGDTLNDDPANLVPACRGCNGNRAMGIGPRKLRPCGECGVMFLPPRRESKYCSRTCARRAQPPRRITAKHGTRSRYARGCRCGPCKAAHATYMAEYEKANPRRLR